MRSSPIGSGRAWSGARATTRPQPKHLLATRNRFPSIKSVCSTTSRLPKSSRVAAAAATSVVLASRIGIAGSVIGAAVSSVVTVVSSQLIPSLPHGKRREAQKERRRARNRRRPALGAGKAVGLPIPRGRPGRTPTDSARPDRYLQRAGHHLDIIWKHERLRAGSRSHSRRLRLTGRAERAGASAGSGTRIAPKRLQARAVAERSATQRKVVAFSIISAVVALVACAAVILVLTAGEGLGTRTTPIFTPATEELDTSADTTVDTSENGTSSEEESRRLQRDQNPIRARRATAPRPIRHRPRARATLPPAAPETERKEADRTRRREMVRIVPEAATARRAAPAVRNPARRAAPEAARAVEPRDRRPRRGR